MDTLAVLLKGPEDLTLDRLGLTEPAPEDIVVEISHSGISTGTEKLFFNGEMPPFPGMGYPLVPGYEAVGEVVEARRQSGMSVGDRVFVPGANCFVDAHGLFGGASRLLVSRADRVTKVDPAFRAEGALLALAATAHHTIVGPGKVAPDLIVGHGVLGRLLARLTIATGAPAPMVWETDKARRAGASGYEVIDPEDDPRRDYQTIYDASGQAGLLNDLVGRIIKGGEIVLAGFYSEPLSFAFPPAFLKEARFRVAAEWTREDLLATRELLEHGRLSLGGLITHESTASDAPSAYDTAFSDPACLKMILNWEGTA